MENNVNSSLCEILKSIISNHIDNKKYITNNLVQSGKYTKAKELSFEIMLLCRFLENLNQRSLDMYFMESNIDIPKSLPS